MQPNWSLPMHAYNLSTCKTQAHTQLQNQECLLKKQIAHLVLFYGSHVNLTQMNVLFHYDLIKGKPYVEPKHYCVEN